MAMTRLLDPNTPNVFTTAIPMLLATKDPATGIPLPSPLQSPTQGPRNSRTRDVFALGGGFFAVRCLEENNFSGILQVTLRGRVPCCSCKQPLMCAHLYFWMNHVVDESVNLENETLLFEDDKLNDITSPHFPTEAMTIRPLWLRNPLMISSTFGFSGLTSR